MSHEIEWRGVLAGSQVWVNNYTWVVEMHAAGEVHLYSPVLDKRHVGRPKPWLKVWVLTPEDPRYQKDWAEKFIDVLTESSEVDGALYREMLLVVRLGGRLIGEKPEGEPWQCPSFSNVTRDHMRLHFLYFHRIDVGAVPDDELTSAHQIAHENDDIGEVYHHHRGMQ